MMWGGGAVFLDVSLNRIARFGLLSYCRGLSVRMILCYNLVLVLFILCILFLQKYCYIPP